MTTATIEHTLKQVLSEWSDDPVLFVRENFGAEPDGWQSKVLRQLVTNRKVALSACKGPGKSCLMAWAAWWILATNVDSQGLVCSITSANLRDGLWKELAFWHSRSKFLQATFVVKGERIESREHPAIWWLSARSFPQQADKAQQANTLAGLHAAVPFIILDEVGDYPKGVLGAASGIFSTKGVKAFLLVGGNPTNRNGPLFDIVTKEASDWAITHITGDPDDPMRSPRIDIDWARREIEKAGRDNPWVMVNVLGLFPPASADQLIDINVVIEAQGRDAPVFEYNDAPYLWGLDPARFGDDESALARRQGKVCFQFHGWRNKDGTELGDIVAGMILQSGEAGSPVDGLFVDVGGVGASAYDRLKVLGYTTILYPVDFGSSASDRRYVNKRTEMWMGMSDWLKLQACLPSDPLIQSELTAPSYSWTAQQRQTKLVLETKDSMRKRGIPSPNRADALALTFAAPVSKKSKSKQLEESGRRHAKTDYDPIARKVLSAERRSALTKYDPLSHR